MEEELERVKRENALTEARSAGEKRSVGRPKSEERQRHLAEVAARREERRRRQAEKEKLHQLYRSLGKDPRRGGRLPKQSAPEESVYTEEEESLTPVEEVIVEEEEREYSSDGYLSTVEEEEIRLRNKRIEEEAEEADRRMAERVYKTLVNDVIPQCPRDWWERTPEKILRLLERFGYIRETKKGWAVVG